MKQLVIHIGAKKTGSTTLQAALKNNTRLLAEKGVYVSDVCGAREDRLASRPYMSCHDVESKEALRSWLDGASRFHSAQGSLCVLTAESFSDMLLDEIRAFYQDVAPTFDHIKVVFYIRRQDFSAVSHYSTALKGGGFSKQLMSVNMGARRRRAFCYGSVASDWSKVFGKESVVVRKYIEGRANDWDIVDDFFQVLGKSIGSEKLDYSSENRSFGLVEAASLRKYNQLVAAGKRDFSRSERRQLMMQAAAHPDNVNKIPKPSRDKACKFYRGFDQENKILKDLFFSSSDRLFDEDFEMYPEFHFDIDRYALELHE